MGREHSALAPSHGGQYIRNCCRFSEQRQRHVTLPPQHTQTPSPTAHPTESRLPAGPPEEHAASRETRFHQVWLRRNLLAPGKPEPPSFLLHFVNTYSARSFAIQLFQPR